MNKGLKTFTLFVLVAMMVAALPACVKTSGNEASLGATQSNASTTERQRGCDGRRGTSAKLERSDNVHAFHRPHLVCV